MPTLVVKDPKRSGLSMSQKANLRQKQQRNRNSMKKRFGNSRSDTLAQLAKNVEMVVVASKSKTRKIKKTVPANIMNVNLRRSARNRQASIKEKKAQKELDKIVATERIKAAAALKKLDKQLASIRAKEAKIQNDLKLWLEKTPAQQAIVLAEIGRTGIVPEYLAGVPQDVLQKAISESRFGTHAMLNALEEEANGTHNNDD
jgi:hypothetical protein